MTVQQKCYRILLCNNTLSLLAGTETAVYTLAIELQRRGHTVTAYSPDLGVIAEKLCDAGIKVMSTLKNKYKTAEPPHVVLANHFLPTYHVRQYLPDTPIIYTVHSILGGPETPLLHSNDFISISPEIKSLLRTKYSLNSFVIFNGVDTKRFCQIKPPASEIKNILVSVSPSCTKTELRTIQDEAQLYGASVKFLERNPAIHWDTEKLYNDSDLVITSGRGVLEAMACNRPVIVYGPWGIDGLVTDKSLKEIRSCNFSGRRYRQKLLPGILANQIKQAAQENTNIRIFTTWRDIILPDHQIKTVADKYLTVIAAVLEVKKNVGGIIYSVEKNEKYVFGKSPISQNIDTMRHELYTSETEQKTTTEQMQAQIRIMTEKLNYLRKKSRRMDRMLLLLGFCVCSGLAALLIDLLKQ